MHFSRSAMKSRLISWMKSARFHHEICQISSWNLLDFMKFAWFHEIRQISWIVDFAVFYLQIYISPYFIVDFSSEPIQIYRYTGKSHGLPLNAVFFIRTKVLGMKSAWFHEICRISWSTLNPVRTNTDIHERTRSTTWMLYFSSEPKAMAWNPPDFMKSARFHEICRISCMKSAGFHGLPLNQYSYIESLPWNPPRFHGLPTKTIQLYKSLPWNPPNFMKSAEFHEICQISWNPPNFMAMKSGGFPNELRTHGPIFSIVI